MLMAAAAPFLPVAPALAQSSSSSSGGGMVQQLNMGSMGGGTNPQINFNPYSPNRLSIESVFEKLYIVNEYNCGLVPWLATKYTWKDPKTLDFTIRTGVKWSDGKPFSANDVAFTFDMLKKNPALDTNGATQLLDSVTAAGDTVTFAFSAPAAQALYQIANTYIVPQHIWSEQQDPVKFTNPKPVTTGPMVLDHFNPQELVYKRNPDYWQADKFKVSGLRYSKPAEGSADQLRLANGEYDWNAMFVPNVQKVFVDRDPQHNHYWFSQGSPISFSMNLTKAPFNDVKFREAMASAIDRDAIAQKAELGYVTTASQTMMKLPGQKDWIDPKIANEGKIPYDKNKALQTLTAAGYKQQGGKLLGKDGKQIAFNFMVPAGWSDWIQAAQIIQRNLSDLGIKLNVDTPTPAIHDQRRASGDFDTLFTVPAGMCSMYTNFSLPLNSAATAPVGKNATSNWIRYQDPATDKLLAQLASTTDPNQQKPIVYQLENVMMTQYPLIPLWYGAVWFEYRTEKAIGWPSEKDPYASPNNTELVLISLRPPK